MTARIGRPPKGEEERTVANAYMPRSQKTALNSMKSQYGFTQLSPFIEEILAGVVNGTVDITAIRQPALELELNGGAYRTAS